MKKLLFGLLLLTSCTDIETVRENSRSSSLSNGDYYMDKTHNICYFVIGQGDNRSLTCVPCDKLQTVKIFYTK